MTLDSTPLTRSFSATYIARHPAGRTIVAVTRQYRAITQRLSGINRLLARQFVQGPISLRLPPALSDNQRWSGRDAVLAIPRRQNHRLASSSPARGEISLTPRQLDLAVETSRTPRFDPARLKPLSSTFLGTRSSYSVAATRDIRSSLAAMRHRPSFHSALKLGDHHPPTTRYPAARPGALAARRVAAIARLVSSLSPNRLLKESAIASPNRDNRRNQFARGGRESLRSPIAHERPGLGPIAALPARSSRRTRTATAFARFASLSHRISRSFAAEIHRISSATADPAETLSGGSRRSTPARNALTKLAAKTTSLDLVVNFSPSVALHLPNFEDLDQRILAALDHHSHALLQLVNREMSRRQRTEF